MMAPASATSSKRSPIVKLESPYSSESWPVLDEEKAATVLDMLCSLLAPIGRYRALLTPSNGARANSRRRGGKAIPQELTSHAVEPPSPPDIQSKVSIGFNSTTRHLETLAASAAPPALSCPPGSDALPEHASKGEDVTRPRSLHVDAVLITGPYNHLLHAHLPLLCYTASMANPDLPQTRLILLSPSAESKVSDATGLPRVGVLGILSRAMEAEPLVEYVRGNLQPIRVPWMSEAASAKYMGLKVESND